MNRRELIKNAAALLSFSTLVGISSFSSSQKKLHPNYEIEATAIVARISAESINMFGITSREQAEREAQYINALSPISIKFTTDWNHGHNLTTGQEIFVDDGERRYNALITKVEPIKSERRKA